MFQSTRPRGARRQYWRFRLQPCRVSIHAPRAGRDADHLSQVQRHRTFQSTRPVRGATQRRTQNSRPNRFQSTRPVRGATGRRGSLMCLPVFQSTRPVRGATTARNELCGFRIVSIHAPRAGRDDRLQMWNDATTAVSIHAPRAGRDCHAPDAPHRRATVSIHAPRAGRDHTMIGNELWCVEFQSTRPVRGAT